ncbi:unnamed protein product [Adineta ricciae]|nr:unnamed protein product [Adineta ricciae]
MGNFFSDLLGIEAASDNFSNAIVAAEVDASRQLRYVLLMALKYVRSFTPIIVLTMISLILLLLVSILFTLNRLFIDLEVNLTVRRYITYGIAILLYVWFTGVQIVAAVKQKSATSIFIVIMACLGLTVIIAISIGSIRRSTKNNQWSSDSEKELLPTKGSTADYSRSKTDYTKLSDEKN